MFLVMADGLQRGAFFAARFLVGLRGTGPVRAGKLEGG